MTLLLVFVAGLILGSLLNVVIIRLPREQRLFGWPRCTRTGEALTWWQLLPVVGWLGQRGRARNGQRLHWVYPVVELLTGLALVLLYNRYGASPQFAYLAFVCVVLILTGAIDWLHRYIYTVVILGATLLTLVFGPLVGFPWQLLVFGALAAGVAFIGLFALAKVLFPGKAAPFGLGDVYLGIFIGASIGLGHLTAALFYGVLMAGIVAAAIVVGRRLGRGEMPEYISYGTYLCLGVVVYVATRGL